MVSRQTTRPLRKLVPAVAIGLGALLGVVGCSAGQVAQTAEMPPAVNGNSGETGDLALRNVRVAFPESGEPYQAGDDAPLILSIVNSGLADDELVGVTSPAGEVEIIGNPKIPGGTTLRVIPPRDNPAASSAAPTTSESPATEPSGETTTGTETTGTESGEPSTVTPTDTAPDVEDTPIVGKVSVVITGLTGALPYGKNVPVTFEFAKSGKITIQLPIATPSTPRPEPTEAAESEH